MMQDTQGAGRASAQPSNARAGRFAEGLVPVLLPTVAGEVHNELTREQYSAWSARYGDAFVRWVSPSEAAALEGQ